MGAEDGAAAMSAGTTGIVTAAAVAVLFTARGTGIVVMLHTRHGPDVLYGVLHLGAVRFTVGCRDVR